MTKITDPTGTVRHSASRRTAPIVTDPTGRRAESVPDILSMDETRRDVPEPSVPQGSPLRPDPNLFRMSGPDPRDETHLVNTSEPMYPAIGPSPDLSMPRVATSERRLSHNEMIEQILGSGVSNQTKFYVIARLGYHEEEGNPKEAAVMVPPPSQKPPLRAPLKKKSPSHRKGSPETELNQSQEQEPTTT